MICIHTLPRYSRLSPGVHTRIPVCDEVYEYLSKQLLPSILVCNLGIVACHLECIPEYRSATKYMKTCKLHCSLVYQSVIRCIAACHLKCKPVNIGQRQRILRNVPGDRLLYPGLLTDTPGNSVADTSLSTLSPIDIPVYTLGDRPLYPVLMH